MKHLLSTTLLVAGVFAFTTTAAQAYDLDHPFYGPSKGKVVSTTSYDFTKKSVKVKDNGEGEIGKGKYWKNAVAETLAYGLTDNWTVYGGLDKSWDKFKDKDGEEGADHGKYANYTLGTSYNVINDGRAFAQIGAFYQQSFESDGHTKAGMIKGLAGYNLDAFTPYAELKVIRPLNLGHDNHTTYDLLLAGYKKLTRRTSAVLGLDLAKTKDNTKDKAATLVGEYNYLLQENLNFKLKAAYLLKNTTTSTEPRATKGYSLGATVQYAF